MGRQSYHESMEQKLHDLSFRIDSVKFRLEDGLDERTKSHLRVLLTELEERRDEMRDKLQVLDEEPEATWEQLKEEMDEEWDLLEQDFEERVAPLS